MKIKLTALLLLMLCFPLIAQSMEEESKYNEKFTLGFYSFKTDISQGLQENKRLHLGINPDKAYIFKSGEEETKNNEKLHLSDNPFKGNTSQNIKEEYSRYNAKMFWSLLIVSNAFQVADTYLTWNAVNGGSAIELNPIAGVFQQNKWTWISFKAGTGALLNYYLIKNRKKHPLATTLVLTFANGFYLGFMIKNL